MNTTSTDLLEQIGKAEEAFTVRRVFGDPFEKDGVIGQSRGRSRCKAWSAGAAARLPVERGGTGTGFAMNTKPFGVFVLKDGEVTWRPAVDVNRMILGGQLVVIAALLTVRAIVKARVVRELVRSRAKAA